MSKKSVKWLYQELPELVSKGILTQEASAKIREYYGELRDANRVSIALIICGVLGAILIGLGIILLLAHNWEELSRFTRAILSIVPLVIGQGLALWVLCKRPASAAFKEGVATFLSLMVGASIALISQTYNIPGDTGTFILTWMFLILPLVYLMQASLPAAMYLIGIASWSGSSWYDPVQAVLFWPLAALIVPHFIWSLRQETYTLRSTILSLVMAICVSFAAGFSLGKTWPDSWVVIFPALYSIFYFIGWRNFNGITTNWQRPLRMIGAIGLFVLAFQFTFRYTWQNLGNYSYGIERKITDLSAMPDHFFTLMIIAWAMLLFYDHFKSKKEAASLFGAVPLLAMVSYAFGQQAFILPILIFNVYLFIVSISYIASGLSDNSLTTINTGMFMLAVLLLGRFFDSEINFILKGLIFIIIGIGFLVVNVLLVRRRGGAQ